jgi:DNA-binding NarL/FixJ family response regulator
MIGSDEATDARPEGSESSVLVIEARPLIRDWLCRWLAGVVCGLRIIPFTSPTDLSSPQQLPEAVRLAVLSIGGAKLSDVETLQVVVSLIDRLDKNPLLVLGDREEIDEIINAIQKGVRGYIPTSLDPMEAAEAVRFVLGGGTFVPAGVVVRSLLHRRDTSEPCTTDRNGFTSLTRREMEVLAHLRHGAPNKLIAHELGISESTVKALVQRILSKLHAINRTEVAYLARSHFNLPADSDLHRSRRQFSEPHSLDR